LKRFYKIVSVEKGDGVFGITLDGRSVKTPAKNPLQVPTKALADAMAREWRAQVDKVDPLSMPINRLANTALDRTVPRFDEVCHEALNFARHDLLCYRAGEPAELAAAEKKAWGPYLKWLKKSYHAELKTRAGIGALDQDPKALKGLKDTLEDYHPFTLTGVHNAIALTGSLVLALALEQGFRKPATIWRAAHVDEDYQIRKWGEDPGAKKVRADKKALWDAIDRFLAALK
jgi:chaperone required for assembly of F1-ATPase